MIDLFKKTEATDAMWLEFSRARGVVSDYAVVAFGDSPEMATELADLVASGIKRATTCSRHEAETSPIPPTIGGYVVLVDGEGSPRCIWQTTELREGPLSSVDDAFAWDEGEGTRLRDDWREGHIAYYRRERGSQDPKIDDSFVVIFERFKVVWPEVLSDR